METYKGSMKARTIWHDKEKSWMDEVDVQRESGDILIESRYSLISQGTEKTMISDTIPKDVVEQMAVPHMLGALNQEFTYGYSLVGKVIEGNETYLDKYVHLMHPHQDIVAAAPSQVSVIPDNFDLPVSTLASNMETAVNAVWDGEVEIGDHVLVAGYGLIGALVARIVQEIPGVSLEIMEANDGRIRHLKAHGFHRFVSQEQSDYDVIFNTTGSEEVLQSALSLTRKEGKVVELSWYGSKEVRLKLGSDFHYGRKQILSSQVSNIPLRKSGVWDYKKRKSLVFELLQKMDFSHLTGNTIPFDQTPQFFNALRIGKEKEISTVIQY